MAIKIRSRRKAKSQYRVHRERCFRIVDLRNRHTALLLKLAHGPWKWEIWVQKGEGYSFVEIGYARTLAQALKEARAAAKMKGK